MDQVAGAAIVLLSGGQDSCTCLAWARRWFPHVIALSFDYNQRHQRELEYAKAFADSLSVIHEIVPIGWMQRFVRSALTDRDRTLDTTGGLNGLPSTFTPGRNLLFLAIAASCAVSHGMQHVVIGASQTDYSGYPDCRREFMDLFEQTFASAIGSNDITVHTPLMNLSKADTFALADRLGVLRDIIRGTLTCYDAVEALNEWGRGCGTCPACVLRQKGYEEWQATKEPAALNG